jgi:hypothetical protein
MNPILQKTQDATLAKADPRLRPVIQKVVEAGKKLLYSDQTRKMVVSQLHQGTDPESIGAGVAKLFGVLFHQSKNTIPMQAGIPAATLLLCEVLQFMEDGGAVKVDANFLAECTKAMGSAILQMLGITPDKLQGMVDKAKGAQAGAPGQPAAGVPAAPPPGIVAGAQGAA